LVNALLKIVQADPYDKHELIAIFLFTVTETINFNQMSYQELCIITRLAVQWCQECRTAQFHWLQLSFITQKQTLIIFQCGLHLAKLQLL